MKIKYLYLIPPIWVTIGILYARSIPKNGFDGVAEVFLTLVSGLLMLVGIGIYHLVITLKKRKTQ